MSDTSKIGFQWLNKDEWDALKRWRHKQDLKLRVFGPFTVITHEQSNEFDKMYEEMYG